MWTEPPRGLARPAGGSEPTITGPTPAEELIGQNKSPVALTDFVFFLQTKT